MSVFNKGQRVETPYGNGVIEWETSYSMLEYPVGFDQERMSRKPICGVLAMAIVANVSFDVARATLKDLLHELYPYRRRFGGAISLAMFERAMKRLAVRYDKREVVGNLRVSRFAQVCAKPGVLYAVRVPDHLITMRDGMVLDQAKHCHWSELKSNRKVTHYYEILGKGW